ncbi:DHH family phosphoesterase [Priestia endophytica]
MKYKLLGNNDYRNLTKTVLENRGIEDIDAFLNISDSVVNDWRLLNNIKEAALLLLNHVSKGNEIFIQVDSDMDGYSSSAVLINYLKKVFPDINLSWRLHTGKQHGVEVETVPPDTKLVIIPDSGSNQYKEHKELKEKGIDVLVLDHHECDEESKDAVIVNNQLSNDFPNKQLSGAGICYKFLQALDCELNIKEADNYLDLVAVGNIGDIMDLRSLETRYYVMEGLKQIKNKFLKALFEAQEYSTKGEVSIISTSFYIVPLINATIRVGKSAEKEMIMKAFLEIDEQIYYSKKKIYEPLEVCSARTAKNIKARQLRVRNKGVEILEDIIQDEGLLDNKVLVLNVTGKLEKNLSGLVSMQLADKYKKPVLLLSEIKDNKLAGSARNYNGSPVDDLKQYLLDTKKFVYCQGHPNAFGVEIKKDNVKSLLEVVNSSFPAGEKVYNTYEIDALIPYEELMYEMVEEISDLKYEWGNPVKEPKFMIKDVSFDYNDIYLIGKKKKDTLKIKVNGTEFIKFNGGQQLLKEKFDGAETFYMNVIGKFKMNEWEGRKTPQIEIEELEVTSSLLF